MSKTKSLAVLVAVPILVAGAIPVIWAVLYFGLYLGVGNFSVREHQEFAANGVSQIKPAKQMDELFDDCRHYITYSNRAPLFKSVAYFGDRYELTMQVPVDIQSASSGTAVGQPKFYLNEVNKVSVSPSVGASFSRSLDFGAAKWQVVYDAGGDFSKIGFNVNTTPVPNFQEYAAAGRPSG